MKSGKLQILAWVAMFVIGCSALHQPPAKEVEPMYQDRRLSEWLRDFDNSGQPQAPALAADAIRHIGTAALPLIVDYLSPARWEQFQREIKQWQAREGAASLDVPRPFNPRHEALAGLDALGSAAAPALPELEKLMRENPPDPRAAYVAARIGPASAPLLNALLTNSNKVLRTEARVCLDMMASHSEVLYPRIPVGPDAPGFDRRNCAFNLEMMKAAYEIYTAEHPDGIEATPEPIPSPPPVRPQ